MQEVATRLATVFNCQVDCIKIEQVANKIKIEIELDVIELRKQKEPHHD